MLNVHLSYKPPSSWREMFRSRRRPMQFRRLKRFRSLVFTSGGFHKGVLIQGRQIKRSFYCGKPVMFGNKRLCNGRVCPCIQTEEQYVHTDFQTIYLQDQTTQTPSLANPPVPMTPPGNRFTSPLQVQLQVYTNSMVSIHGTIPHKSRVSYFNKWYGNHTNFPYIDTYDNKETFM